MNRREYEEFAELCRRFPKKFAFVATLPLPNVENSIEEFFYATEKIGALGVNVASNSDGIYLGDERFTSKLTENWLRGKIRRLQRASAERLWRNFWPNRRNNSFLQ